MKTFCKKIAINFAGVGVIRRFIQKKFADFSNIFKILC